ncbi:MAG TPA: gluconokinase [Thermoanaerobaculia bacterium]
MVVILMGVSGAGKTTVGRKLAAALGWTFYEGDDLHAAANVEKMSRGISLTDEDRRPWLLALRKLIEGCLQREEDAVVTCSALKRTYREVLKDGDADVVFVYLKADPRQAGERLERRLGHFAKGNLLESQFATLEEPSPEEALAVDASKRPEEIVEEVRRNL